MNENIETYSLIPCMYITHELQGTGRQKNNSLAILFLLLSYGFPGIKQKMRYFKISFLPFYPFSATRLSLLFRKVFFTNSTY